MIKVAIAGYGVVGGGAAALLRKHAETITKNAGQAIELKYILVRHDYPDDPCLDVMVQDFSVIENDP